MKYKFLNIITLAVIATLNGVALVSAQDFEADEQRKGLTATREANPECTEINEVSTSQGQATARDRSYPGRSYRWFSGR
jgi:hypothetical protein